MLKQPGSGNNAVELTTSRICETEPMNHLIKIGGAKMTVYARR